MAPRPVITAESLEKEEAPKALDEGDIALLKTYVLCHRTMVSER